MSEQGKGFLDKLYKYPFLIFFVIILVTIFFAFQLPKAQLDNNNIRFVPEHDEARLTSRSIDEIFGSSVFILVGLECKDNGASLSGDVFDAGFLDRVREFDNRMREYEIVGNVNSLVSSDYIYANGDSIIVQKLLEPDFKGTPEEIYELKQKILSWDIYSRSLVSDDFKATQILVPLTVSEELAGRPELVSSFIEIRDIAKEMFSPYADVYVTGIPIISATINESMRKDLQLMIPLVVLVVIVVLFISFRRLDSVVLPLLTVIIAAIWSMGAMPLFDIKLSVISTVLPVILVAVGSAYGIHIVTHYLEAVKLKVPGFETEKALISREEHFEIIMSVVRKIGKAVFLAALTTLVGFFSFSFTTVIPIREFSYFATFGVLVSFLVAITLIPSLLIVRGPPRRKAFGKTENAAGTGIIPVLFTKIAAKKVIIILVSLVVVGVSIWGINLVILDNIFVEYFKTNTDIYRSDRFIREKFAGSKVISVVVQADSTEILLMPEVLKAMDDLGTYLEENVSEVGKVMGFTDLVKRMNQVFNADESPDGIKAPQALTSTSDFGFDDFGFGSFDFSGFGFGEDALSADAFVEDNSIIDAVNIEGSPADYFAGASYYEIPSDPKRYGKNTAEELMQLVSNYLVLLSGNITSYANDPLSPTAFKSTVQLRALGDRDTGKAINIISGYINENFPLTVKTIVGGVALVENSLNRLVVQSQIISVFVSILVVFCIIAVSNKSLAAGAIGIMPLSICILINFAVMGFAGIKLNIGTSMVASVSVGIGIDYTIHCMEAYKREYRATGGKGDFLFRTFAASGKAILINAISVGAGFAVLVFSQFIMLRHLGLLIALTMCSSAFVSLTLLPVLLSIFNPKFISGQKPE